MKTSIAIVVGGLTLAAGPALAVPSTIWAVEASATGPGVASNAYAEQFSLTGDLLRRVTLGSGFDPSGIAIVGNTAYVTSDTDGLLRSFNTTTGAIGATVRTGQNANGALTFDGTALISADATGGNRAYRFTLGGVTLSSVVLGNCGSYCAGLEYEAGSLFSNRGDNAAGGPGPYDRYNPTTSAVLTANAFSGGDNEALAYNTDSQIQYFAVSGGQGGVATSQGGFIRFGGTIADSGFGTTDRFINDLAFQVPEPATLALLAGGLGLVGLRRRRR